MQEVLWFYARGPKEELRRWPLGPGQWLVGRGQPKPGKLDIPWDPALSRRHFTISPQSDGLLVEKCEEASNPVFWQGEPNSAFELKPGEHFVAGDTRFQLLRKAMEETPDPAQEFTLAHGTRQRLRQQRAQECLQALTRLLPELKGASGFQELGEVTLEILTSLLPEATRILILKVDEEGGYEVQQASGPAQYAPSRRLLRLAFKECQTAIHQWDQVGDSEMTMVAGVHWALAVPLQVGPNQRFAIYAMGSDSHQSGEQERALVDLVGEALGHFLVARQAEQVRAQVSRFFSPSLRDLIDERGMGGLLKPERRAVTVLFFDLRGFSKATERAEEEALEAVMRHHSILTDIMTLVTECVFEFDGIVLDYAGDAVMAGWGAPQDQPDQARLAVDAACEIVRRVNRLDLPFGGGGHPCGLGLGCGEVVAGQVGGEGHFKYGWIGGVVNQAARLEGLTKYFGVPILITGPLRKELGPRDGVRRLGMVRPAGMAEAIELFEVSCSLSESEIESYERGEEAFARGDMLEAIAQLRQLPVEDTVARFLTRLAFGYEESGLPEPWDGVIEFRSK